MNLREVIEYLKDALIYIIIIAVIVFIFTFIVGVQPLEDDSMSPTIDNNSITLVSKVSYRFSDIKRNDIVVIKKDSKSYIKRVIALPGETIEYSDGYLYINSKEQKEKYLDDSVVTYDFLFEDVCSARDCPNGTIPKDKYFVMGDNRQESSDSRNTTFGLVDKSEIIGKSIFKIWPINKIGKL